MQYRIAGIGFGGGFIEISDEEFRCVKVAKQKLLRSLTIEDKFDLVLANFADFERELLDMSLHRMVYSDISWSSMHLDRQILNRRIANLLSAGRLYLDQIMHDASAFEGDDQSLVERLRKKASEQYAAKLGYRAMEMLRNYTQHRSLPVHQLSYATSWSPPSEFKNLVYRIVPRIALQELREDCRVKRSVVEELEAIGPHVPLTPLIREYVEGLSVIHEEFRRCTKDEASQWEASFSWAWERYNIAFGSQQDYVQIAAINDAGECAEAEQIFRDLITHWTNLTRKNQILTNLALRFVSGRCEVREK